MPQILHDFQIIAPAARVFEAITTPSAIERWWSVRSSGTPEVGRSYELYFGPEWDWRARVSACEPNRRFEWEMTRAMDDWMGTRVGFGLRVEGASTQVQFQHRGWAEESEHFRISSYCWAMHLRLLKIFVETGESIPYEERLRL